MSIRFMAQGISDDKNNDKEEKHSFVTNWRLRSIFHPGNQKCDSFHYGERHMWPCPSLRRLPTFFAHTSLSRFSEGNRTSLKKTMAWTSAGVFVARLIPFLHVPFPGIPSHVAAASYLAAVLIVIATIALVLRTMQDFNWVAEGR